MALLRVQATSGKDTTFASSCSTTAFGTALTYGSIILVAMEFDTGATNSVNSVTDTAGNTYSRILSKNETGVFNLEIWYTQNKFKTASNIVTATDTSGGVDSVICAEEWIGQLGGTTVIDVFISANDGGAPSTALNSGATSQTNAQNEVLWCAGAVAGSANNLTPGSGFTNVTQNSTSFSSLGIESRQVYANGTYNGTFTAASSGSWVCGTVTIKQSTIVFDQVSSSGSSASNSFSWNHTVGTGNNKLVIVGMILENNASTQPTTTAVSFNGVAMTNVRTDQQTAGAIVFESSIWFLNNPPIGTSIITTTTTNITTGNGFAASYFGCAQVSTADAVNGLGGTTAGIKTFTITTIANNSWIFCTGRQRTSGAGPSFTGIQVERFKIGTGTAAGIEDTNVGTFPAGAITVGWNCTAGDISFTGFVLSGASFAPFTDPADNLAWVKG